MRPVKADDCAVLANLVTQLGYPADIADMRRRYEELSGNGHGTALVAEYRGAACGMAGVDIHRVWHRDEPVGHISSLVVDETVRGEGVGAVLLNAAEHWLRERGVHHVTLTSASRRTEAHRFYLNHSYSLTGQRFAKML